MTFVEGSIKQYLFYNEENNYSVIRLDLLNTSEISLLQYGPTVIVCGFFPRLEEKQVYRFYGEKKDHPKYGVQFQAERFERMIIQTRWGIIDYLSSDLFKGIGPKTAEKIVDILGVNALDEIANNPDVLDKIPHMNQTKKDSIKQTIVDNRLMESTLVWLYGFDVSPKMAIKIYQHFGFEATQVIKDNPYILMEEIEGIGFKRADEIALKIGFSYDHPLRIKAIIHYLIAEYMNKYGDTFLYLDKLVEYTLSYLNANPEFIISESQIRDQIDLLVDEHRLFLDDDKVSLFSLYKAELSVAKLLKQYINQNDHSIPLEVLQSNIKDFEVYNQISYTEVQVKAIISAIENQFVVITGGPGTGKTTVIKGIKQMIESLYPSKKKKIRLAAPTGKAAKRLSEACDAEATTIHRLLGIDYEGNFAYDEFNYLDADVVIIDEVSMLDVYLAKQLFQAIKPGAKVILVGDDNQLPSVGPGQVLRDIMESDLFDIVKLNKIHRQAHDSSIISLAYDVLNQQVSEYLFQASDDMSFIRCLDQFLTNKLLGVIQQAIQNGYSLLEDIQVLVPMYKGINGIDNINQLIQEKFNPHFKEHKINHLNKTFCFKDKVMQLINQPEDGVMNGDIGEVISIIEDKEMIVDFSGVQVKYSPKDFDNLTLAYAISIHKSQGSEFRLVILPMVKSYAIMLKRKLLYTGITRAKEKLIMIGDYYALKQGILGEEQPRNTRLKDFLLSELSNNEEPANFTIDDFLE